MFIASGDVVSESRLILSVCSDEEHAAITNGIEKIKSELDLKNLNKIISPPGIGLKNAIRIYNLIHLYLPEDCVEGDKNDGDDHGINIEQTVCLETDIFQSK